MKFVLTLIRRILGAFVIAMKASNAASGSTQRERHNNSNDYMNDDDDDSNDSKDEFLNFIS